MTYKTGQMFVRLCGVNCQHFQKFKTLRLRDRWTYVDKTWHVQSNLRILNSVKSTPRLYRTKVKAPAADID